MFEMVGTESKKTVQLYFYTMTVERTKKTADDTAYNIDAVVQAFSDLLTSVNAKDLIAKTHQLSKKSKVIWLDFVEAKGKGCFNLVFKSAKYDQSRTVRNTETMENRGILKQPEDGDEEKTHLLIRFRTDANRFIAAIESNYYGVGIGDISAYLNEYFDQAHSGSDAQYSFKVAFDILPSEEFLKGLDRMKKTKVLMAPTALMMMHRPLTVAMGNTDDMRQAIHLLEEVKESILNAYEIKTGLSRAVLSEMMDQETWLSANKAVELGFADGILEPAESTAPQAANAYQYSSRAVSNLLLNKLKPAAKPKTQTKPGTPVAGGLPLADLEKRLGLLRYC